MLTGNVSHDIKVEQKSGKSHKQAVAIALSVSKKKYTDSHIKKALSML